MIFPATVKTLKNGCPPDTTVVSEAVRKLEDPAFLDLVENLNLEDMPASAFGLAQDCLEGKHV